MYLEGKASKKREKALTVMRKRRRKSALTWERKSSYVGERNIYLMKMDGKEGRKKTPVLACF